MKSIYFPLKIFRLLFVLILLLISSAAAQDPEQSLISVSNITSWVGSEGFHDWVVNGEYNGAYPNGLPVGVIFTEGICWGGLVHDGQSQIVRVNGNNYGTGCSPINRLYRVRSDYYKADLTTDAADFFNKNREDVTNQDLETIRNQYEKDRNEWPADRGAPYYDVDKDGEYNPGVDVPGVPGALQTLFIKYNDDQTPLYGSPAIGLEVSETYWAYNASSKLGSVIYKKIDIIYKGLPDTPQDSRIDSMYICQMSDTDIGNSIDDFIGCDTSLNLGYTYNSSNQDKEYIKFGLAPPAAGYSIIQGVSEYTGNKSDSAVFNFKWVKGYKYSNHRPLTVAILHRTGGSFSDPSYTYTGALEFYNLMSGYVPYPPYPVRRTNYQFKGYGTYMLPGDPITRKGKIDGIEDAPGDRRMWLMNGPFNMSLGDTAEVVIALVGGMGKNYLASVSDLKHNAGSAVLFFNTFVEELTNGFVIEVTTPETPKPEYIPANYVLYQNYPNPFNSFTTIRYEMPEPAFVRLIIYDVLGREVKELVNEEKPAGSHRVQFDAKDLPSGVYFYKISFYNESNKLVNDGLNKTMKLVLLK